MVLVCALELRGHAGVFEHQFEGGGVGALC